MTNYEINKQLKQIEEVIKISSPDNALLKVLNLRYRELTKLLKK